MVDIQSILIGVAVLLVIYLIYMYFFAKSTTKLVDIHNAQSSKVVSASAIPKGSSNDYTYSIWFYVNDWSYRYGEPKVIFQRMDSENSPAPSMEFASGINNLHIHVDCYNPHVEQGGSKSEVHTCVVQNVPLQTWTNVIMTVNNRAVDVYLDGKLVRTCILPGTPVASTKEIQLTPAGGFSGYTSNFEYKESAISPREAYEIYKNGYGGGGIGSFFNKYRLKFAFMEDNKEVNSLEI